MSYRDLRNFAEMMRALGYPRLISLENFRNPNFPLVAEVLIWLAKRYEPTADPPTEIETEQERVMFVRSMAQFMVTTANIKLNTKKIYQADGHAVKELLKITTLLYSAMKSNSGAGDYRPDETALPVTFDIGSRIQELKQTRTLATDITTKGATLFDLLRREVDLREVRQQVLSKNIELNDVESSVAKASVFIKDEIENNKKLISNVATDEANLDAKIEKKKTDLDRSQKRLGTLKKVRPAFMDEFERLEEELKKLYNDYIDKFRCLAFLEAEMEDYERTEETRMKERQAAMKQQLEEIQKTDNSELDIGLGRIAKTSEDMMFTAPAEEGEKPKGRPGARVFGSMQADFDELGSDTSLDLNDDDLAHAAMFSDEEVNLVRETAAEPSEEPLVEQEEPPAEDGEPPLEDGEPPLAADAEPGSAGPPADAAEPDADAVDGGEPAADEPAPSQAEDDDF